MDRIRSLLDDEHDDIVIASLQLLYQLLRHTSVRNALPIRNDTRLRARLVVLATTCGTSAPLPSSPSTTDIYNMLTLPHLSLPIGEQITLTLPLSDWAIPSNTTATSAANANTTPSNETLSSSSSSSTTMEVKIAVKELMSGVTRVSLVDSLCRSHTIAAKHRFAVAQNIRQAQTLVASSSSSYDNRSNTNGVAMRYNGFMIKLLSLRVLMSMSWLRREVVSYLQRTDPLLVEGLLFVIKSCEQSLSLDSPSPSPPSPPLPPSPFATATTATVPMVATIANTSPMSTDRMIVPVYIRVMIIETIAALAQHSVFVAKLRTLSVTNTVLPFLLRSCITRLTLARNANGSNSSNSSINMMMKVNTKEDMDKMMGTLIGDHYLCYSLLELVDRLLPTSAMDAGPWMSPNDTIDDLLLLLRTSSITCIPLLHRALSIIERLSFQHTLVVSLDFHGHCHYYYRYHYHSHLIDFVLC